MIDAATIRELSDAALNDAERRQLLVSAIAQQGGDREDELLSALARRLIAAGLFDEAEEVIAAAAISPLDQVDLLIALADALNAGGQSARADDVVRKATALGNGEGAGWQRGEALLKVGRLLGSWGRNQEGIEVSSIAASHAREGQSSASRQDSLDASSVLAEAVEFMAESGDFERARATAREIKAWVHRRRAKARISALASRRQVGAR